MGLNNWRYAASRVPLQWARSLAALLLALALAPIAHAQAARPQAAAPASEATRTVLVMGDSLSAGYGLSAAEGWVALTADRIAKTKPGWRVVNASISGETTAGGAARIVDAVVRHKPAVVVIELGANDGLRGLPLREAKVNLARMIGASQSVGAKVLLIGMRIPPNYGPEYTQGFERNYTALAKQFDVALLPFLLQPVASDRANFQNDNLHPVAAAQPKLRDHVWTALEPLLK
ncbi:arylesterase [Luteimonas sp. SX5]|uniref:Arylesterase n=1 Tax=Luteimonas galliterrae TaxID=2940486 RepID=A0ABT0MLA1_9GAMM|nr:arylesterase [Luteimonas galliterrae]MCL1635671.1 arylesterase [Luteimonas galliterrae]